MSDSLTIARDKLTRVLAIYTPMRNPEGAQAAMTAALAEFEAAVRADERIASSGALEAAQRAHNDALAAGQAALSEVAAHRSAAEMRAEAITPGPVPTPPPFVPDVAPPVAEMQPKFDSVTPKPAPFVASVQPEAPTLADMGKPKAKRGG